MQLIYKKYLIKINKLHLFFILLIFLLINFLYFFSSKNCRTYKSILAVYDLGLNQLIDCYSIYKFKTEIKITLKNHALLYNLFKKIYHTNILYEDYNIFQNDNKNIDFKFDKKPSEIKGLIYDRNFKNNSNAQFPKLENDDWFRSHGGNLNHKYSHNGNINRNNIGDLKLAWQYTSINQSDLEKYWKRNIQLNPIFINNKIIFVTPDWKIVALEGHSGKKIWSLQSVHSPSIRGMVSEIEKVTKNEIIFLPVGNKIYKIDAKNGKRIKSFGKNGYVSTATSIAPIIYNDFLISINFSGFVDLFNKYDGKFISSISIHPKKNFRGGNPWSGGAFDYEKGLIFVNTGNPHPGTYGVNRPGNNKNSSSVVAIDVNNKKIIWTFQETAHDLWDFDIASPPIIHNLKIDKIIYEVVILLSKTGNTIVLDRNTGLPIFDIIFEKVPKSDVWRNSIRLSN